VALLALVSALALILEPPALVLLLVLPLIVRLAAHAGNLFAA
jgi:hypothetical protein